MPDRLRLDRDVVEVSGPDSATYLQGQLSQDVAAMEVSSSTWSWILAPTGKVDALVRVVRTGADDWLLDTDGGWGDTVITRLTRFKLRTKVEIKASSLVVVGLRGTTDPTADPGPGADGIVAAVAAWPGIDGLDVFQESPREEDTAPLEAAEVERIAAGRPRMGAELTDKTMPAETGLVDLTVSFTKGCYTGQELVARVDSRGSHTPRHLRALSMAHQVQPGTELYSGDQPAGVVTSVAESSAGGWIGLGFVRRGFEPPLDLSAGADGPTVAVRFIAR